MSVLKIELAGSPILKKESEPVKKITSKLRQLLDDMADTMYKSNGVGLAAPQIGQNIRMVVVDVGDGLIELINPKILSKEGTCVDTEGCLSVPTMTGEVERAEKIEVEFLNRFGKKKILQANELLARCIQHEIDHLDGILFIDIAKNLQASQPETDEDWEK